MYFNCVLSVYSLNIHVPHIAAYMVFNRGHICITEAMLKMYFWHKHIKNDPFSGNDFYDNKSGDAWYTCLLGFQTPGRKSLAALILIDIWMNAWTLLFTRSFANSLQLMKIFLNPPAHSFCSALLAISSKRSNIEWIKCRQPKSPQRLIDGAPG